MSKAAKSGGDHFTRWLVIGMVSLVVLTGVVFSMMSSSTKANESFAALKGYTLAEPVSATLDTAAGSGLVLNPGGAVRIDLWEDPQCPVCRTFESSLGEYIDTLVRAKKATVVYHIASFLGSESIRAANAMMCAADEGHYLDFHQSIYLVQPALENSGFFSNENLVKIGDMIGLKSEKFTNCVTSGSKLELVKTHAASLPTYKVQGTPTVFINGKLWQRASNGFDLSEFRLAVEAG
ncbi:MAG: thioredoxin domain-containing protein [Actinomycetota bacterium]|nr:thioredoxin domain-containing protein [Actinomycetota bacterium]